MNENWLCMEVHAQVEKCSYIVYMYMYVCMYVCIYTMWSGAQYLCTCGVDSSNCTKHLREAQNQLCSM